MLGTERPREPRGAGALVGLGQAEAEREGPQRAGYVPRGQRGDQVRVDARREQHAKRHVAHEAPLDGVVEQRADFIAVCVAPPVRSSSGSAQSQYRRSLHPVRVDREVWPAGSRRTPATRL